MAQARGARSRQARGTRASWLGLGLGTAVVVSAATAIAARFARLVLTPAPKPDERVVVVALEDDVVWLRGPDIGLEGGYSFIFDVESRMTQRSAGHARLGPVRETRGSGVRLTASRPVLSVDRGELRIGARGRITGWWYMEPEQLGHEVRRIALPLPGGVGEGWLILPERPVPGRWAIHVHGRGALPEETLRGVAPFAEAGVTSLVISYRNDPGAPPGLRGRYGLGLAECEDVDAALGWARGQGADRVTLVGWSMGGTAVVLAAGGGRNADLVDGIVLDSPALDWPGILRRQARAARLPGAIADLAMLMLSSGIVRGAVSATQGTSLGQLGTARLASLIRVPTLIHASADDTYVPWRGSLRVAQLRSALVRLHPAPGEHVKIWNVDPRGWEAETAVFIASL